VTVTNGPGHPQGRLLAHPDVRAGMTTESASQETIVQNAPGIQPIVCVKDIAAAVRCYRAVGFEPAMEVPGPDGGLAYAILRFGDTFLHVSPLAVEDPVHPEWMKATNQGPRGLGVQMYVMVRDVAEQERRVRRAGMKVLSGPKDEFWGDRVFIAEDPFGYIWNFAENVAEFDPSALQEG
jgi:uncharacterized glyoxalase superfamily protein PhnB